jgi:hypothetical protein
LHHAIREPARTRLNSNIDTPVPFAEAVALHPPHQLGRLALWFREVLFELLQTVVVPGTSRGAERHFRSQAFGLPVRTVVGVVVKESILTVPLIGIGGGVIFLNWMLTSLATTTLPDVGIDTYLSPGTIMIAATVGIVAVAAAPLFLVGRLRRMDLPGTLRVME